MPGHVVVVGYGAMAVDALRHICSSDATDDLVVLDVDAFALTAALANGAKALRGDGRDPGDLRRAGVPSAARVIIAAPDDDGLLTAIAVRSLTESVAVTAVIRQASRRDQFLRAGVDEVLLKLPRED
ncbi:NAD-binding protein [Lentzea albida]|uniref:TrkA-N domain-containing protein n=1 Tax=Lentzea albida TaxID=65499 RepID=A0A1H9WTF7_9PSEU|nr:NAD-binding protein [Lentzea albida]SES37114.1 TrkA-N domain-containing protein [Lentzea albida]